MSQDHFPGTDRVQWIVILWCAYLVDGFYVAGSVRLVTDLFILSSLTLGNVIICMS